LSRMIDVATHVPTPSGDIPMFDASLPRNARTNEADTMAEIATHDPQFRYMFTKSAQGAEPERCRTWEVSGLTTMRSHWGPEAEFMNATHVAFDVGPYRTSHSDLDALNLHLYGGKRTVLPDSGLYSYEKSPIASYFHGTRAHNTVVVDGLDQKQGTAFAGALVSTPSLCWQSAWHGLYAGVKHARGVAMLDRDVVLVLDELTSAAPHSYAQTWHAPPDAAASEATDGALLKSATGVTILHVAQAPRPYTFDVARDQASPVEGLASLKYEQSVAADTFRFVAQGGAGATERFATALVTGPKASLPVTVAVAATPLARVVTVTVGEKTYTLSVGNFAAPGETAALAAGP
jgi:hypothetical protein